MIEIPEAYTIAGQLENCALHKQITKVTVAHTPHKFAWYYEDGKDYDEILSGKSFTDVKAASGRVFMHAEEIVFEFGDGVNIRYLTAGDPLPAKHQLLIEFDDQSKLVCTVQMYGFMMIYKQGENDNFYSKVSLEKPSPLSDAFDWEYFRALYSEASPKLSVKAFLATEQRIPGLGNGCLHDILLNASLHPKTKLSSLDKNDIERMFHSIKQTLKEMTEQGGRDVQKDLYDHPGNYKTLLSSKTWKEPCPKCFGFICRRAYLGGNIYYCENCQPEK